MFLDGARPDVTGLQQVVAAATGMDSLRFAAGIEQHAAVYDGAALRAAANDPQSRRAVMAELSHVLDQGSGILVIRDAVDGVALDAASAAFRSLIAAQHAAGAVVGDHFAAPGANDRVWNALEKLALADPITFCDYYGEPSLAMACEAWLGPWYQVTSQINVVNPGGVAQSPHCDYHLGFQGSDVARRFPAHVHEMSRHLTLQGAIAHVDMPIEAGPTFYVPHSHKHPSIYLDWYEPEIADWARSVCVQPVLSAGDAVFFNPSLLHGAGTNRTADVARMANLLQVSSPFGRAMESVDRTAMCISLYPVLLQQHRDDRPAVRLEAAIAAAAEGYAFPTNLDRDPPVGGLAPASQADLLRRALDEQWDPAAFEAALHDHARRRLTT